MTRTLYVYISRDLAKVTLMALVAFTLVMTVFGVSEPLRKQGLSGMQVLSLFGYTVPVMVSLTLPIAALLGGTLVYGRFSQNNEFLAAKASGVSAVHLLKPAMALGILVTVLSLVLSSYVTPAMARRGAQSAMDNVEGLVFQQLRTKNYVENGRQYVHATRINAAKREVRGVVAADISNVNDVRFLISPLARIRFGTVGGEKYATFVLCEAVAARTNSYDLVRVGDTTLQSVPLRSMSREDVSWYDLDDLVATLQDPTRSQQIRAVLINIRRRGCMETLAKHIVRAINAGGSYRLTDGRYDYVISAGGAETTSEGVVKLLSRDVLQGVRVVVLRGGKVRKTINAESGRVLAKWSDWSNTIKVALELRGLVSVRIGGGNADEAQQRSNWDVGNLEMPTAIAQKFSGDSLRDVYLNPGAYTSDASLLESLSRQLRQLAGRIRSEMHVRVAYSLSCCLMVAMGAALGLMFKGGQLLSAFAISIIPASLVIVMIVMGKELMNNESIDPMVGLEAIWGGLTLLALGNVCIYAWLMRR